MTSNQVARRVPIATMIVLAVVIVVSVIAFLQPDVMESLRRNPDAIASGQWWRFITALFVQADGWLALLFNGLGVALIGAPFERRFGSLRFLLVYFVGGLAGQIAGYWWDPYGAGASVAMFGLVGAWALYILRYRHSAPIITVVYTLFEAAAYVGLSIGGATLQTILIVIFAVIFGTLVQRSRGDARPISLLTAVVALVAGLLLTVLRDNHGPSILVGALLAFALLHEREDAAPLMEGSQVSAKAKS